VKEWNREIPKSSKETQDDGTIRSPNDKDKTHQDRRVTKKNEEEESKEQKKNRRRKKVQTHQSTEKEITEQIETTDTLVEPVEQVEPLETTDTLVEPVEQVEPLETTDKLVDQ